MQTAERTLDPQAPGGVAHGLAVTDYAFILQEDPELGAELPPADRRILTQQLRAPVLAVMTPRWQPPACNPNTTFGLLVLDGLLGRRVRVGQGVTTELLGPGDILRPWEDPVDWTLIPAELDWRIMRPTRLAVLNERVTQLIGRYPPLLIEFSARLERRVRCATYIGAIGHLTRVEERLLATLRYLAVNWGRVTPDGVKIPFRLTHEVLGEIIGAQRPSVTTGLAQLQRRGWLSWSADRTYLVRVPEDWTPLA